MDDLMPLRLAPLCRESWLLLLLLGLLSWPPSKALQDDGQEGVNKKKHTSVTAREMEVRVQDGVKCQCRGWGRGGWGVKRVWPKQVTQGDVGTSIP